MKIIDEFIGRSQSTSESATVALNAAQEAYAYVEAERKNTLSTLLTKAVENLEASGIDPQEAFNVVAQRGQYIKELSRGTKMFHQAAAELKEDPKPGLVTRKFA
jgi:hypothetical protein